jgi:hypothetical protein
MTNIISWFHKEIEKTTLIEAKDPIPMLLDKLSSSDQVKIKIHSDNDNVLIENNRKVDRIEIPQNWDKENFQAPGLDKLFSILSNKRSPNFPTTEQKYLLSTLKAVPIYTVVNDNNEIVTASPRESKNFYSLKWIQEKMCELFFWNQDEGSISINLFFMNKEDASSYLHEICKKEPREAENSGLKIKIVGLDVFYKLNRTSPPKTQNRLVADLKEVDSLLANYINSTACIVHPKQKYARDWFQGNPIYTLKLQTNFTDKTLSEYSFHNLEDKKFIFFSREDALKAWKNFLSREIKFPLNHKPKVEIYNLESFLFDMENLKEKSPELIFVPPYDTYMKLKGNIQEQDLVNHSTIQEHIFKMKLNLRNLQRFYKGIIWLFTSDTLPTEENSW